MALAQINFGGKKYVVVDLTTPLRGDEEIIPGDPRSELNEKIYTIAHEGFNYYVQKIGDHSFRPHFDSPNHQNAELQGVGAEFFGLDYCYNRAFMLDFSEHDRAIEVDGLKYLVRIEKEDLELHANMLASRDAVLLRTGYDRWIDENRAHGKEDLPHLSPEAAEFLAGFKRLKVVGTDSLTIDAYGVRDAHHALTKDRLVVESLVNLYEIPQNARADFYLETSPVRIVGATGGPVIARAFVEE